MRNADLLKCIPGLRAMEIDNEAGSGLGNECHSRYIVLTLRDFGSIAKEEHEV